MSACAAIDGQDLKRRLALSIQRFASQVERINRMNVFPVPDGDTGTNMQHTLQRAWREIAGLQSRDASLIMRAFAQGALMGARGNSGTILSQLFKGFAAGLGSAAALDERNLPKACQSAVKLAYAAVTEAVEGTILTVARQGVEGMRAADAECGLSDQYAHLLAAAEESLRNTPNLLPILRQAGVVDAGAMGLVVFLAGLAEGGFDGEAQASLEKMSLPEAAPQPQASVDPRYGYDVQFLMRGEDLDLARIRRDLQPMGDSLLVVGDARLAKVHIHVANPALPIDYGIRSARELDDIVVENMQAQSRRFGQEGGQHDMREDGIAVIAVAPGPGFRDVLRELGCDLVISGGQGRNPSVEDFLRAIARLRRRRIILLPNNRNITLTARQAADLRPELDIRVLPTESVLQGISAMIAFGDAEPGQSAFADLMDEMRESSQAVVTVAITRATRASRINGVDIHEGDCLAIVDGEIRAAHATIEGALLPALGSLDLQGRELASLYYGAQVPAAAAAQMIQRLSAGAKALEWELVFGGQPHYPYLIGLE